MLTKLKMPFCFNLWLLNTQNNRTKNVKVKNYLSPLFLYYYGDFSNQSFHHYNGDFTSISLKGILWYKDKSIFTKERLTSSIKNTIPNKKTSKLNIKNERFSVNSRSKCFQVFIEKGTNTCWSHISTNCHCSFLGGILHNTLKPFKPWIKLQCKSTLEHVANDKKGP